MRLVNAPVQQIAYLKIIKKGPEDAENKSGKGQQQRQLCQSRQSDWNMMNSFLGIHFLDDVDVFKDVVHCQKARSQLTKYYKEILCFSDNNNKCIAMLFFLNS